MRKEEAPAEAPADAWGVVWGGGISWKFGESFVGSFGIGYELFLKTFC